MLDIIGVVNEMPVPKEVPPELESYQFKVPLLIAAPSVTVPASQVDPLVTDVIIGLGVTVILTLSVLVHPLSSVPVTVYVVVEFGEAVTDEPLPKLKEPDGDHE